MEELLKEILAELKKLNTGIIMSADDMLALLERGKKNADDQVRSVYREVLANYKDAIGEKPKVKEQKEKAHPLENRVVELEKTIKEFKSNSIIIKASEYQLRTRIVAGQLFLAICPIQPEPELF